MYDAGPVGIYGTAFSTTGSSLAVSQPVKFDAPVLMSEIGVGVAMSSDPNGRGFRVTLAGDYHDPAGTALGAWNIEPCDGTSLAYCHVITAPIRMEANRFYYVVFERGDSEFVGGVAWAGRGYTGYGLKNNGLGWFETYQAYAVRIGGYVVPEPGGLVTLAGMSLGVLLRQKGRRK